LSAGSFLDVNLGLVDGGFGFDLCEQPSFQP